MKCRRTVLIALGASMVLATGVCWPQNEAEFGNNLSVPVVFAEGYGIGGQPTFTSNGLRGQMGLFNNNDVVPTTCFDTTGKPVTGCYLQQTAADWQAEWVNGAPATTEASGRKPGEAVIVNWSDNLISQRWTPSAPVRVEVVLYQKLDETPTFTRSMNSFNMLFNSGKGSTEMWGTDGKTSPSSYRTVFSPNARLKIEKLGDTETTAACGFNGAIWEAFGQDGPGFYAAEINVSGNLIYGFNWNLNKCDATRYKPEGTWRLTFMLDSTATLPDGTTVEPNVLFAGLDPADITVDAAERAPYATPVLQNGSTSYMDIQIVAPKGGGRAGSSGRTETEFGNNLAVPAVFAEGYGLTGEFTGTNNGLRGTMGLFNGNGVNTVNCYDPNNIPVSGCYLQQTAADWQAQTADGMPAHFDGNSNRVRGEDVVVNWSDNLISQRWTPGAPVRIEVVLYQNKNESFPTFGSSMKGFNMFYNSGKGSTEMWGTNNSIYMSDYRTVFSINARLKIEKLLDSYGNVDTTTTSACGFNGAIWEAFNQDGPGFYVAEVNVSGNLIYGFNWMLNQCDTTKGANPVGKWRLTFSLDPSARDLIGNQVLPNVKLASLDPADTTSTDGEKAPYAIPVLVDESTSVLDIEIVNARGGGSSRRPR
jgi:hypothetical protein